MSGSGAEATVQATAAPGAAHTPGSPFLHAFWTLSSLSLEERVAATRVIVTHLKSAQAAFEDALYKHGSLAPAPADRPCCHDLTYALGRLARGVASPHKAARQGFALALTEVLIAFPAAKTADAAAALLGATQASKKSTGEEQRDAYLGRVFGIAAIARAGRMPEASTLPLVTLSGKGYTSNNVHLPAAAAPASAIDAEGEGGEEAAAASGAASDMGVELRSLAGQFVSLLFVVSRKKTWVTDLAYEAIAAVIEACGASVWQSELEAIVATELPADKIRAWSPDQLGLALALEPLLSSWFVGQDMALPSYVTAIRNALSPSVLARYRHSVHAEADGSEEDSDMEAADASARPASALLAHALLASTRHYPRLHSVWGRLLQRWAATGLAPCTLAHGVNGVAEGSIPAPVLSFTEFWRVYVDELLVPQAHERKATALALFTYAAPVLAQAHPAALAGALSPLLVRTIVRSLASRKRILYSVAQAAVRTIVDVCRGRSDAASSALVALLARGHPDFDKRTHTKTIALLLAQLDDEAVLRHVANAQREFATPSTAPVYADIASAASGLTGVTAPEDDARSAVSGSRHGGSDAGSEGEEDEKPVAPSVLSPTDARRLWALDTMTSALTSTNLHVLRHRTHLTRLLSYLAYHAYADVTATEAGVARLLAAAAAQSSASSTPAAASSSASGRKRARASSVSGSDAAFLSLASHVGLVSDPVPATGVAPVATSSTVRLLVADPPMSDYMRAELRSRLVSISRMLASPVASTPAAGAKHQPRGGVLPTVSWHGLRDRIAAASDAACGIALLLTDVWSTVSAVAEQSDDASLSDADATVVSAVPSRGTLDAQALNEEDEEDEEAASTSAKASDVHTAVVTAARLLQQAGCAVSEAANAVGGGASAVASAGAAPGAKASEEGGKHVHRGALALHDAARALLAFANLFAQGAVHVLHQATAAGELAAALADILHASAVLLQPAVKSAHHQLAAAAPSGATPSKKKKAGGAATDASASPSAGVFAHALSLCTGLLDTLRALLQPVGSVAPTESGSDGPMLVYTDAMLALLANSNASLRDALKSASRFAFDSITSASVSAVLAIVTKKSETEEEEEEEDADSENDDDGEDDSSSEGGDEAVPTSKRVKAAPKKALTQENAAEESEEEEGDDDEDDDEEEEEGSSDDDDGADEEEAAAEEADDDELSVDAEVVDADDAEMETYDRMLGSMIRARKEMRAAAKAAHQRMLHFKYRCIDMLEVAVGRLSSSPLARSSATPVANPRLLLVAPPMLKAIRYLAIQTKAKRATTGREVAVEEAADLLKRLQAVLTSVTKARFPVATSGSDSVSSDDMLDVFRNVIMAVQDAPTPAYVESCAAVAQVAVKSLRGSTAPSAGAGGAAAPNVQPAVEYLDDLAAGYSAVVTAYFTEPHTRLSASFFKPMLAQTPALSVRLLPTLSSVVAAGAVTKAFKLVEAFTCMLTVIKASSAAWTRTTPCAYAVADAVEAEAAASSGTPGKKKAGAAPTAAKRTLGVGEYLHAVVPAVVASVASVLRACAQAADADAAPSQAEDKAAAAPRAPLNAKHLREPLALVTHCVKQGLGRGSEELEDALAAVAELSATATSDVLRRACDNCLSAAGMTSPPPAEDVAPPSAATSAPAGEGMEVEDAVASAPPASAQKARSKAGAPGSASKPAASRSSAKASPGTSGGSTPASVKKTPKKAA